MGSVGKTNNTNAKPTTESIEVVPVSPEPEQTTPTPTGIDFTKLSSSAQLAKVKEYS